MDGAFGADNQSCGSYFVHVPWESWKCFGFKIAAPFIPLILGITTGVILSQVESKEDLEIDTKYLGLGGSGLFAASIVYAKHKHNQQKEIDNEIQSAQEQISARKI